MHNSIRKGFQSAVNQTLGVGPSEIDPVSPLSSLANWNPMALPWHPRKQTSLYESVAT